jgi:hypothetical protein
MKSPEQVLVTVGIGDDVLTVTIVISSTLSTPGKILS